MEWYYADASEQQVVFQEAEFSDLVKKGAIKPTTLVWNATMSDWLPASKVQPAMFAGTPALPPQSGGGSPYLKAPSAQTSYPGGGGGGAPHSPPSDGLSIAAMVCGILSLVLSCAYIGFIPGIAAIVCGHKAKSKSAQAGQPLNGMALAGLIMGYIGTVIGLFFVIGIIAAIAMTGTEGFKEAIEAASEPVVVPE